MTLRQARRGRHCFVWDPARLDAISACVFEPDWWRARGALTGQATGRGAAYFLHAPDGRAWVLRHNRRGGVLATINHDRFFWPGVQRARPFAELRLLAKMRAMALPVPAPVAAQTVHRGVFYRADVLTERIEDARPLADRLAASALPAGAWRQLGATLARFHRAGIRHADLNSRNLLVDSARRFYLVDFDKAHEKKTPGRWREANLALLRRSLNKFRAADPGFGYRDTDWAMLRGGYDSGWYGS